MDAQKGISPQAPPDAVLAHLLRRHGGAVPRYTSYPTAVQFGPSVDASLYAAWLRMLPPEEPVSIYLHVPFCDRLCLYCGCHAVVARQEAPRWAYARRMIRELEQVAATIGRRLPVSRIHWGGGTPSSLPPEALEAVDATLRRVFAVRDDAELSVEIDPRHLSADHLDLFARLKLGRASLGVQDLDPAVQRAVGRIQDAGMVSDCIASLRGIGVRSIHLDLIYGLPLQTEAGAARTAARVSAMAPDRLSVFGYAHVPWVRRQQRLIPADTLPGAAERFRQRAAIDATLRAQGYGPIGIDHYAQPNDALAVAARTGRLHRNFQGYTTDDASTLIGVGASAIGRFAGGYVQNHAALPVYGAAIDAGELAVSRGVVLSDEDRLRAAVICTLMCEGKVDLRETAEQHGAAVETLLSDLPKLSAALEDGLVTIDGAFVGVREAGMPFLRGIAAVFDRYRAISSGRHAMAV
ncbi:oxygen-independent coproporphyrinogen III oxidase [Acetobacteraceae bacterium KSS8]|uniref:Coproporphyrinogen-III oxidase n=1 Tax=Endosaccharibacter trunci TaxID=2812733 RepID=A0ABT1W8Z3_9PROT|nr:oxygen-independent coproporphyrinogen III oxidase [Acetobacteraceae bacterium KSS8]